MTNLFDPPPDDQAPASPPRGWLDWVMLEPLSYLQRLLVAGVCLLLTWLLYSVAKVGWPGIIPMLPGIWAAQCAYGKRVYG